MIDENEILKFIEQVKDLPGYDRGDFDDLISFVNGETELGMPQQLIDEDINIAPINEALIQDKQTVEEPVIEEESEIEIVIPEKREKIEIVVEDDEIEFDSELIEENESEVKKDELDENNDIRAIISKLKVAGRVKLAMFGNSTCRGLLIQDPLKLVQFAVLRNPRIQESEIEVFCKNPNTSQAVMRYVVDNKKWFKSSFIKLNLCKNPKCPPDISIKLITFLHRSDVRDIARSKNLPSALATAAKRLLNKSSN